MAKNGNGRRHTAQQSVDQAVKSICDIMRRIDTERNFLDVLDKVRQLSTEAIDPTHVFTLSQVYEGLLLKMGEKGNEPRPARHRQAEPLARQHPDGAGGLRRVVRRARRRPST